MFYRRFLCCVKSQGKLTLLAATGYYSTSGRLPSSGVSGGIGAAIGVVGGKRKGKTVEKLPNLLPLTNGSSVGGESAGLFVARLLGLRDWGMLTLVVISTLASAFLGLAIPRVTGELVNIVTSKGGKLGLLASKLLLLHLSQGILSS